MKKDNLDSSVEAYQTTFPLATKCLLLLLLQNSPVSLGAEPVSDMDVEKHEVEKRSAKRT